MNKFGKIVSLTLAVAVCMGSACFPVLANEVEVPAVALEENLVSIAAVEDFSIENNPYSYVKTFDDDEQIKSHILYNESSKYKNVLSTSTSNPGIGFGPGYKDNSLILTFYSGHRDDVYGGKEKEDSYGNAAQLSFTTAPETVYANPTTGGLVKLSLEDATVGANKVAFWTKAQKKDTTNRAEPEFISYSISFRNSGASNVNVRIPNDGEWHYIVADLANPIGRGFDGINVSSSCDGTFGSTNGGKPVLKLDGKSGIYPLDKQERPIKDIAEAYVLVSGEYKKVKAFDIQYGMVADGAYVNIPDAAGNPAYYRTDNKVYIQTKDENGGIVYVEDENGNLIFDIKSGKYVEIPDVSVMNERYDVASVESYLVDEAGEKLLDEEGNPIPQAICGNLTKEIWREQIFIDDMLFYRTTESGNRTTFLPSSEEDVEYYSSTALDSVLIDGVKVFDVDEDGDYRVISIPRDVDLANPDLSRFLVVPKCPDVVIAANKDGGTSLPVDPSVGTMKSGAVGSIKLPANMNGKAIVTITSALGTNEEYSFDLKPGLDLSVIAKGGEFTKITRARRNFTLFNYAEDERYVQVLAVIRDRNTNELVSIVTNGNPVKIDAGASKQVGVTLPSVPNPDGCVAHFYFYDSATSMNQVCASVSIIPEIKN